MSLISPEELASRRAQGNCVVVDCRFDLMDPAAGRAAWHAGRIPGAHYAHLDEDLAGPAGGTGGRHPLPAPAALAERLEAWGISNGSLVVAYDAAAGATAARLWWLLRWLGHAQVAVLDGGWPAWSAAGLPVESGAAGEVPARGRFQPRPGQMPVVDAAQLAAGLAADRLVLIDVRAGERFAGRQEPLDPVAGHVPGALNLPLTDNVDADGRFLLPASLAQRFRSALAGKPASDAVMMCGSGVTACHGLLAMAHAGLPGAALYAGSWSDWISDPDRPVGRF